jgi:hypothetical protein
MLDNGFKQAEIWFLIDLYMVSLITAFWDIYQTKSKIFRTDAAKLIKLTIKRIGRHHPRSSSLPHVETGTTVSLPFLQRFLEVPFYHSVKHSLRFGLDLLNGIKRASFQLQFHFCKLGRSHRVPNQGSEVVWGWQPFYVSPETARWERKCETGRCRGEEVRFVLDKIRDDVFARFHAVGAKRRSRTRN